jgi:hypothetical protein
MTAINQVRKTAECSVCGERKRLRSDGTVWNHTDKRQHTTLPFSPRCEGVNQPPKPNTEQVDE